MTQMSHSAWEQRAPVGLCPDDDWKKTPGQDLGFNVRTHLALCSQSPRRELILGDVTILPIHDAIGSILRSQFLILIFFFFQHC